MKQTAVEWFAKELNNWRIKEFGEDSIIGIPQEVFDKAKEMEKEQMKDSYKKGFSYRDTWNWELNVDWNEDCTKENENKFEQYYNETFKSE